MKLKKAAKKFPKGLFRVLLPCLRALGLKVLGRLLQYFPLARGCKRLLLEMMWPPPSALKRSKAEREKEDENPSDEDFRSMLQHIDKNNDK